LGVRCLPPINRRPEHGRVPKPEVTMPDMSNTDVAGLLDRYGRLLAIDGEGGFRVRAYQRAAEAVRHFPEPIAEVARAGRLQDIEGIGAGIAGLIDELLRTGTARSIVELESRVPPTLLEIAEVPGVGTKTVARLHAELGVVDL
jgi:DNA polymerase (family X)